MKIELYFWLKGCLSYVIQNGSNIGTLLLGIAAVIALFSWRQSLRANKMIDLIDELVLEVDQYFYSINASLTIINIINSHMDSLRQVEQLDPNKEKEDAFQKQLESFEAALLTVIPAFV